MLTLILIRAWIVGHLAEARVVAEYEHTARTGLVATLNAAQIEHYVCLVIKEKLIERYKTARQSEAATVYSGIDADAQTFADALPEE